jgi:hypothetical protein
MLSTIISNLGGAALVARELGVSDYTTVASWQRRRSIPVRHWPGILALAERKGVTLSTDDLLAAHAEKDGAVGR